LFKIDHGYRDFVKEYLADQANGKIIPGPQARKLLERGLKLQHERNENLSSYVDKLKNALPGGVALQAWLVELKLHAASASAYLADVPFVTQ
jgi:methyl coenzyme M reductase alpha subunit